MSTKLKEIVETNLSLMSFKSMSVRTVRYLTACLSSVSYPLVALWVRNIPPPPGGLCWVVLVRSAFAATIPTGLICDHVTWSCGFACQIFKMSWFSPSPDSISDMVVTGVLDCPPHQEIYTQEFPADLPGWLRCYTEKQFVSCIVL